MLLQACLLAAAAAAAAENASQNAVTTSTLVETTPLSPPPPGGGTAAPAPESAAEPPAKRKRKRKPPKSNDAASKVEISTLGGFKLLDLDFGDGDDLEALLDRLSGELDARMDNAADLLTTLSKSTQEPAVAALIEAVGDDDPKKLLEKASSDDIDVTEAVFWVLKDGETNGIPPGVCVVGTGADDMDGWYAADTGDLVFDAPSFRKGRLAISRFPVRDAHHWFLADHRDAATVADDLDYLRTVEITNATLPPASARRGTHSGRSRRRRFRGVSPAPLAGPPAGVRGPAPRRVARVRPTSRSSSRPSHRPAAAPGASSTRPPPWKTPETSESSRSRGRGERPSS